MKKIYFLLVVCGLLAAVSFAGPNFDGVNDTTSPGTPGSSDPVDGYYYWSDPVNWNLDTMPAALANVNVRNNAKVKIDGGEYDYNRVYSGSVAGLPAYVKVTGGTLHVKDQVAPGWSNVDGYFIVDGGTVDIYGTGGAGGFGGMTVGNFAKGHFELISGTVNCRVMTVGVQPTGSGVIRISGGTLTVSANTYLPQNASAAVVDMIVSGTGIADIGTLAGQPAVDFTLPGRNLDIRDAGQLLVRGGYSNDNPIVGIKGNGILGNVNYSYDPTTNKTTITALPEPASLLLLGLGGLVLRKRK